MKAYPFLVYQCGLTKILINLLVVAMLAKYTNIQGMTCHVKIVPPYILQTTTHHIPRDKNVLPTKLKEVI